MKRRSFYLATIGIGILFILLIQSKDVLAKCAVQKPYYCQNIEFQNKIEPMSTSPLEKQATDYCQGTIKFETEDGKRYINAVFSEKGKCPEKYANIFGTVMPICQDTGRWTNADYVLFLQAKDNCSLTQEERLEEVKTRANKISLGMNRIEVEKIFLDIDSYQSDPKTVIYYEYPDVLIAVPYDDKDTVNGEVKINKGSPSFRESTTWFLNS